MQIFKNMRITYKFLLNQRRKSNNNEYSIILRIYHSGRYKEHALGEQVCINHWNDELQMVLPTLSGHEQINSKIASIRNKLKKMLLLAELNESDISLEDVFNKLKPPANNANKTIRQSIINYGRAQIELLNKSGNVGNAMVYNNSINKLREYAGTDHLSFTAFTYQKVVDFNVYLLSSGIKVNTASLYLRTIRAIYNRAIKEGIVSSNDYPFRGFKIKQEKTISRSLTIKEMQSIISLDLQKGSAVWHWRNYFLLSFCLIGINFADMLKLERGNIIDGRIVFRRSKTGKIYSISINSKALEIMNYYSSKSNYLLPILPKEGSPVKLKNDTKQAVKTCNQYLKKIAGDCKISKNISTYYARYTFANIARQLGYSKDLIAEALGHEYGNRVTGIYLDNYDNQIIDTMVIDVVNTVYNKG
jgi:integrase/recombinase XerD